MTETATQRYRRSNRVQESRVGDRMVLYHRDSRHAAVLNPTGAGVWSFLAEPKTTNDLAQHLQDTFSGLERDQALADVKAYLEQLIKQKMVLVDE